LYYYPSRFSRAATIFGAPRKVRADRSLTLAVRRKSTCSDLRSGLTGEAGTHADVLIKAR
jgi:hypothetical protein